MEFVELEKEVGFELAVIFSLEKLSDDFWKELHPTQLIKIYNKTEDYGLRDVREKIVSKIDRLKLIHSYSEWRRLYDLAPDRSSLKTKALEEISVLAENLQQYLEVLKLAPSGSVIHKKMFEKISNLVTVEEPNPFSQQTLR
ncbi:hypothetical protein AMJ47_02910 [Parcubacteria bacterium DG_72]|nr:MAG: hypothetical protein AMJ47_02910 [Parcubacteria bacterium DG_72]